MVVRYVGGGYLIYLGIKALLSKSGFISVSFNRQQDVSHWQAFRQGFLVNALNPKAMFFIFSLYILIAKLNNPWWDIFFIIEMTLATTLWFMFVVYCISHPVIKKKLLLVQKPVGKFLGLFLIVFGLKLWLGS
jgi:threonine/homoserine/homoserine lactone efflux protein